MSDTAIDFLQGKIDGLNFGNPNDEFLAEFEENDFLPQGEILLDVSAAWNDSSPSVGKTEKEETFFVFREPLEQLRTKWEPQIKPQAPNRVAVYWDASGSQGETDSARKIELLQKYFADKKCPIDLVVFRDKAEPVQSFSTADERFFQTLRDLAYDGGTNFSALTFQETKADVALLFTDGNSTFEPDGGKPDVVPPVPVYTFLQETGSNDARLRFLAESSGGEWFAWDRETSDAIAAKLDKPCLKLLRIESAESEAIELCWSAASENMLLVAGRLAGKTAKLRLHFGYGKTVLETVERTVEANDTTNDLPGRMWAQLRLAKLLDSPQYDRQAVLDHGKKYQIVTPETSLLVLESVDQYVEFEIDPPASRPEWLKKFREKIDRKLNRANERESERARDAETNRLKREKKIEEMKKILQREWDIIVRWWEHPFRMPQTPLQFHLAPKNRLDAFGLPRDRYRIRSISGGLGGGMYGGFTYGGMGGGSWGGSSPKPHVSAATIYLQPDPATAPYLNEIVKETSKSPKDAYQKYLQQKKRYGLSPKFYVHCADYFAGLGEKEFAVRILSNLSELGLDQKEVRRTRGLYLLHWDLPEQAIVEFEQIADTHLAALAHARIAERTRSRDDLQKALDLYGKQLDVSKMYGYTLSNDIERHLMCLVEANRLVAKAEQWKLEKPTIPYDAKLAKPLDGDIRIVAFASHDGTSFDFAVTEPSGEIANRTTPLSLLGGAIAGSESCAEYMIRRAGQGKFKIALEYFGNRSFDDEEFEEEEDLYLEDEDDEVEFVLLKPVNPEMRPGFVYVEVYTHYGRENETRRTYMIELKPDTETYELGTVR